MTEGDGVIRLVTEPEACAQFTMRCAQDQGIARLRKVCLQMAVRVKEVLN